MESVGAKRSKRTSPVSARRHRAEVSPAAVVSPAKDQRRRGGPVVAWKKDGVAGDDDEGVSNGGECDGDGIEGRDSEGAAESLVSDCCWR